LRTGHDSQKIVLAYGTRQAFRYRCEDINILGFTALMLPVRRAEWRLNGGPPINVYVERQVTAAEPAQFPWGARTPAVNRLRDLPGHFNIEIPTRSPHLCSGLNQIVIRIEGDDGEPAELEAEFSLEPTPVGLPLDLSDFRVATSVQEIGQVVDGLWDIDQDRNVITTRGPVAHDALLLLGGPHRSQEATYNVVFSAPLQGDFLGLSDFFVRHDEQQENLGIKPGYSTAGLATLKPDGTAQCWAAMGDNTWDKDWSWVRISTPVFVAVTAGMVYAVRHQVIFDGGISLGRFRIWPAERPEPKRWLCSVHTPPLSTGLPRPTSATFGLFQHQGNPTQWSNVLVRAIEARIRAEDLTPFHPLVDRWRRLRYTATRLTRRIRRKLSVRRERQY
jgi:hypothetical protein